MIAIATTNPDTVAETYVRQHIREIAPGQTAVLYFQGKASSLKDEPRYRVDYGKHSPLSWRLRSLGNFLKYAYPGAITGSTAKGTRAFLEKHNVQAILAEFGPTGCALLPICKAMGIRLIVNFHGYDATVMPNRWLIRRAYRYLNAHADGFVCGSRHFAGILEKLGFSREKIEVIPCGIEIEKFNPHLGKDKNLLVAVGRFTEKKAPHLTIQAFSKVKANYPNIRLEMIGEGALLTTCKQLCQTLKLEESVTFHGAQSHDFVKAKLAHAGLFVQHSVTAQNGDMESQGISLLEAMASGVPVISTRHNGFTETVAEGKNGYLVAEKDVDGMAEAISTLLGDDALRKRMGAEGRKLVEEKFDSVEQAKRLRHILMR